MNATHWADRPFLCLDTETTGTDPFEDRIVQAAAVTIDANSNVCNTWSAIINPGVEIPDAAAEVHKITTERARAEGLPPASELTYIAELIWRHHHDQNGQGPVVMFNARFDWPILLAEAARHHVEFPIMAPVLDPYLLDRMCDRFRRGKRRLELVADHYGVQLDNAHDATADATAAGLVMRRILDRFPELREHTLASLWLHQAHGHEQDRQRFVDWKRRDHDPGFDTPAGWPVPVERSRP